MKKYALPAAAIAAVAVLSGTSGAVATSLITGAQIKDGTVTGADIKNGSLSSSDLNAATRAKLVTLHHLTSIHKSQVFATAGTAGNVSLNCPAGDVVVSASGYWNVSSKAVQVVVGTIDNSLPTHATAYTEGSEVSGDTLYISVICGRVS